VVDPVVDKAEKQITQALRSDEQENLFELLRKINL
jgi:hypothetical protein